MSACGCREAMCPHVVPEFPDTSRTRSVLAEVSLERLQQDAQWGGASHDDTHKSHDWIAYIVQHAGRAVVWPWDAFAFRRAMVKVAALAVAAVEWADRDINRAIERRAKP